MWLEVGSTNSDSRVVAVLDKLVVLQQKYVLITEQKT